MQQQCQDREVIEVEVKEKVTIRKACACSFFLWLHYFSPQIEKSLAHATFVIFFFKYPSTECSWASKSLLLNKESSFGSRWKTLQKVKLVKMQRSVCHGMFEIN